MELTCTTSWRTEEGLTVMVTGPALPVLRYARRVSTLPRLVALAEGLADDAPECQCDGRACAACEAAGILADIETGSAEVPA